jgi:hypothetical protein
LIATEILFRTYARGRWDANRKEKEQMTMRQVVMMVAAITLVSCLTGCAMFNKGSLHYNRTTTIGKELLDLQEAKARGAITEEEYVKAKKDILAGGPLKVEKHLGETK